MHTTRYIATMKLEKNLQKNCPKKKSKSEHLIYHTYILAEKSGSILFLDNIPVFVSSNDLLLTPTQNIMDKKNYAVH